MSRNEKEIVDYTMLISYSGVCDITKTVLYLMHLANIPLVTSQEVYITFVCLLFAYRLYRLQEI